MSDWIQWCITTIIALVGIFVGRYWERHDHSLAKDRETLTRLKKDLPYQVIKAISDHDFNGA